MSLSERGGGRGGPGLDYVAHSAASIQCVRQKAPPRRGTVKNEDREEERDDLRDRFLVGAGTQTIKNQEERRGIDFDVVVKFVERTHTRLPREPLAVGFCGSKFVCEWKGLGWGGRVGQRQM